MMPWNATHASDSWLSAVLPPPEEEEVVADQLGGDRRCRD